MDINKSHNCLLIYTKLLNETSICDILCDYVLYLNV